MKLDYKKTFLLGLGFFSICLVWSLFNSFVPIFLRHYISSNTIIGFLMTIDNYAGLILQPTFGTLSDRTKTPFGKRMPYLMIGMPLAAISVMLIPSHWSLVSLVVIIVFMNVIMATFRSPTVALMPDITPEPLRSKANSIINLMGGLGAVIAFLVGSKLYNINSAYPFYMAGIIMIGCLIALCFNIKEKRDSINYNAELRKEEESPIIPHERLRGKKLRSLLCMLAAIFLWFSAFDAVNIFFTLYGKYYLHVNEGLAASKLTFFSMAMLVFAIPAGIISTKIGRKKTIIIGLVSICAMFFFMHLSSDINMIGYIFIVCGAAWALININSYPLLLSMTTGAKIGRFTGYYYAFSCLAGIISPTLVGIFIDHFGYPVLFNYSVVGFVLALIVLLFVKEPKSSGKADLDNNNAAGNKEAEAANA